MILINPGRGDRIDGDNQDDWSLRYSIRDISTFDKERRFYASHTYDSLVDSLSTLNEKLMIYLKSHK